MHFVQISAIVSGLDLDKDGVVQYEEFKLAWSMVVGSVRPRQVMFSSRVMVGWHSVRSGLGM